MKSPLLFVHIPKSAGTSFRNALEQKYGKDRIVRDYAVKAPETSEIVRQLIYQENDFSVFHQALKKGQFPVLAGHFAALKYARISSLMDMVTFVREPVARVVSEYKHFVRHNNYKKSLLEFASKPAKISTQCRVLHGVPYSSVGIIGITERYDESLALLKNMHQLALPSLFENTAPQNQGHEDDSVSEGDLEQIRLWNHKDIELYDILLQLHQKRMALHQQDIPYTFGQFQIQSNGVLSGWAFQHELETPVVLNIHWNGCKQHELIANQFNMKMRTFNSPRLGYIGFQVKLAKNVDFATIDCIANKTGQSLVNMIHADT
jgi:hypothetical protein